MLYIKLFLSLCRKDCVHLTQRCWRLFGQTRDVLPNRKWSLGTHVQSHKARCEMKDRAVTKDAFNYH